jgi:hypothetical protein
MKMTIKFGYVDLIDIKTNDKFICKVKILNETENYYEVNYIKLLKGNCNNINLLSKLVKKTEIYDIHEKKLNWFFSKKSKKSKDVSEEIKPKNIKEMNEYQYNLRNSVVALCYCLSERRIDESKSIIGGEPIFKSAISEDETFEIRNKIKELVKKLE